MHTQINAGTGLANAEPPEQPQPAAVRTAKGEPRPTVTHDGKKYAAPNPYLALVPEPAEIDWSYWRSQAKAQSAAKAAARSSAAAVPVPVQYDEREPVGTFGENDTQSDAEPLNGFGTGRSRNPAIQVNGDLAEIPFTTAPITTSEENGAISFATDTGIGDTTDAVTTSSVIGDGLYGTNIFGGPGVRTLSPLSSFLAGWGLPASAEDAVIDAIIAEVRENIRQDLIDYGLNDQVAVKILNSRDNRDQFGRENISRVIVGGTIEESGIPTIGVAQSIDPGNFGTEETALVLLDILSGPVAEWGDASLNYYLTPASDKIGFIGQAVGNVVSHEVGHYVGSFHVDQFNDILNLMDQGGNFPLLYGVGPDGVGGTADDPDVDFAEDIYNPNEGFTGLEDTLNNTAWGFSRSRR